MDKFLSVEYMQEKLSELGNKAVWDSIEKIADPLKRLAYRQLFFLSGGSLDLDE